MSASRARQLPVSELNADQVLAHLAALRGREDVPQDYLGFRIALLRAQLDAMPSASPSPARLPLIADCIPRCDEALPRLLQAVARAAWSSESRGQGLRQVLTLLEQEPRSIRTVLIECVFGSEQVLEQCSETLRVPSDALEFVGRALAAPFVTAAAKHARLSGVSVPGVANGCPYCESHPGLAIVAGDDGARSLCCSLCTSSWAAPRVACPFCGERDKLGTLRDEQPGMPWVETCDGCQRFIITIDRRVRPETAAIIPIAEILGGFYLQLAAEQHGYRSGSPYVALG
jgi:formate dehydrogenase maturation protein FdhE